MKLTASRLLSIGFLAITFAATIATYVWFIRSPYFGEFMKWARTHGTELLVALVIWKIAAIVWPPIPGSIVTFGAIPVVGWVPAYLADFTGSTIGSAIAYWIAYRWGTRFVAHLLGKSTAEKLQSFQVPRDREFEAVFVFRIMGAGLVEAICYAGGLLRVRFDRFMLAITLSHLVLGLPAFYLGRDLFQGRFWTSALLVIAFAATILFLRKRYLVRIKA